MAYELAGIESAAPQQQSQPVLREEKSLSMYGDDQTRYAQALAKVRGEPSKNDTPIINDSVEVDPSKAGASLPLSPQLAALARKEQKFRQEQQKFKASALALEAERKELAELKSLREKIAAGDYSEADKFVDYEKYVQHKLGKDQRAEDLEVIRADMAALKAAQKKDVDDRYEAAIGQRRVVLKEILAKDDTNSFKAIKKRNGEAAVIQLIEDTWQHEGVELEPQQAAEMVEAELRERAKDWSSILEEEKSADEVKKELPPLKTGMKTLTNNMASTGQIKPPTKPLHLMSEQERYTEARRRYEEKLQNGMR